MDLPSVNFVTSSNLLILSISKNFNFPFSKIGVIIQFINSFFITDSFIQYLVNTFQPHIVIIVAYKGENKTKTVLALMELPKDINKIKLKRALNTF